MSLQRSSCAAQSATTHSENTAKHSDFTKGKIIKLAFELRNLGYSEAYLKTLIRALNCIASKVNIDNTAMVLELIARGKWRDSYKSNLCDFYSHCCKFYNINLARMFVPKMVKNGFNSVLQTSAGSRRLVATRNSGTNAKSKTVPKSQKANKNHFTPII